MKDSIVWTLTANDSNQLWIGTRDGLVRHDQDRFTTFSTNQGLTSNEIWDLLEEPDGALWIGTYNGLNYYKDGKFTPLNSFSKFPVTSLYKDNQGAIWIGTNGDGLIRYQQNKFARISTKDGLLDDFVFETLEDSLGNFWISSSKGIYVVKKMKCRR